MIASNAERQRLQAQYADQKPWLHWGPYLSERQWGTVREDYSPHGTAWEYFPHDHARSRAYRWGEDGIAGISDRWQRLCFSVAMWNGQDPILKERLFGLTGNEGNHGEDVKEQYFYLDSTPTHSYMKHLYKYPQRAFPYADLVETNARRSRDEAEYELLDTGIFDENRYWDVFTEYAKAGERDILVKITAHNRGPEEAELVLLPTLWFRNLWSPGLEEKPSIQQGDGDFVVATRQDASTYRLYFETPERVLFTENESNTERLWGQPNATPFVKDAFHKAVTQSDFEWISGKTEGTKCAPLYRLRVAGGQKAEIRLRLTGTPADAKQPTAKKAASAAFRDFDAVFSLRKKEADEFYAPFAEAKNGGSKGADLVNIQRQAFAGMLWSKQYYHIDIPRWLNGDPGQPAPPESRKTGRNSHWNTLNNEDIISMPDKWEYPWYAAWDLAFHCVPLAMVDPQFAKNQLILFLREWYMHPNGQLPAYEWAFGDVNPPVHAWACLQVYKMAAPPSPPEGGEGDFPIDSGGGKKDSLVDSGGRAKRGAYPPPSGGLGGADVSFLKRVFQKLLLNFTWWVNRKDAKGNNVFEGGFLGLDNIGVFDRSNQVPGGGHLEQADGTAWMAMYCLNMLEMALEIAQHDDSFEDVATKFFEHFVYIAESLNRISEGWTGSWDEEEGFFYDVLALPGERYIPLKVRSLVGLSTLFAAFHLPKSLLEKLPDFTARLRWFQQYRKDNGDYLVIEENEEGLLLSLIPPDRLRRLLHAMLDENEFLSPGGIRSLSKAHAEGYSVHIDGEDYGLRYEPAESSTGLFGGNSNWRGPVWMPMNYLLIQSLREYHEFYGTDWQVEYPTYSGHQASLSEVADGLAGRLVSLFQKDAQGHRPVNGEAQVFAENPDFQDLVLFYEYFHGDTGRGVGASHQTGWTGLVGALVE